MPKLKEYIDLYNKGILSNDWGSGITEEDIARDGEWESFPLKALNVFDIYHAPKEVQKAFKKLRIEQKIDNFDPYGHFDKNILSKLNQDDVNTIVNYLRSFDKKKKYEYEPDKDYYAVRVYRDEDDGLHSPYDFDSEGETHNIGNEAVAATNRFRRGYSVNGIRRNLFDQRKPEYDISRMLHYIDDPEMHRELLENAIKEIFDSLDYVDDDNKLKAAIVKTKGKDIDTRDIIDVAKDGNDIQRNSEDEHLLDRLTPIEVVNLPGKSVITQEDIEEEAKKNDMSVEEFRHSKKFIEFIKSKGLALDDIKAGTLGPYNNMKSRMRKVVDRVGSRGYDNILSDEHLKIKERFI